MFTQKLRQAVHALRERRAKGLLKLFRIPSSRGEVQIELADGSLCVKDPEGEEHCTGWSTIDQIAEYLVEWAQLSPGEAKSVAHEAVRQWEEWLGTYPHKYPRRSN